MTKTPYLLILCFAVVSALVAASVNVPVSNSAELLAAIDNAQPGHTIVLARGFYPIVASRIRCDVAGTAAAPIIVRSPTKGSAIIQLDNGPNSYTEGFLVSKPYWIFENLVIEGTCSSDTPCEHAWHVVGESHNLILRNNIVRDFNAIVKANKQGSIWPNDVLIVDNEFYNTSPRQTSNPVTPIDVVGGRRWVVRGNYIHDAAKAGGNQISYQAFLKGNSRDGIFESNLVCCSCLHTGGTRVGLSLGGGGSSPNSICEDNTCTPEHQNGILRNNIILNCNAIGIYINEGQNTKIFNNVLYSTSGIDMRFASTSGEVGNNIYNGNIRNRDGATHTAFKNVQMSVATMDNLFNDPGSNDFTLKAGADTSAILNLADPRSEAKLDWCGNTRGRRPDIGAIEYSKARPCANTNKIPWVSLEAGRLSSAGCSVMSWNGMLLLVALSAIQVLFM